MSSRKSRDGINSPIWTAFAVLAVIICGAGLYLVSKPLLVERPPESAEARLVRADVDENPSYSDRRYAIQPVWQFTASDGETYEVVGESVAHGNTPGPTVGDTSTIYYYPEHPKTGYVIETDQDISQSWGVYFVALPILFVVALFIMRRKEAQEKQ